MFSFGFHVREGPFTFNDRAFDFGFGQPDFAFENGRLRIFCGVCNFLVGYFNFRFFPRCDSYVPVFAFFFSNVFVTMGVFKIFVPAPFDACKRCCIDCGRS